MKNEICFTLKVRSGKKTPLEVTCEPLNVNSKFIMVNGYELYDAFITIKVEQILMDALKEIGKT